MKAFVALVEERNFYGLNKGRWWVGAGVGPDFPPQTKVGASQVFQVGVIVPQMGEYMRHVPEIDLDIKITNDSGACRQDLYV